MFKVKFCFKENYSDFNILDKNLFEILNFYDYKIIGF